MDQAGEPESQSEIDEAEFAGAGARRKHVQIILSRAVIIYGLLFMGLGLIMSALGANPLANNGLMPKILLVFVGLALLIALGSTLTDLFREQSRNWLRLTQRRERTGPEK